MEQFDYNKWKENPQGKVVTRDGIEVKVLGYKSHYSYPVEVNYEGVEVYYSEDGLFVRGQSDSKDLFFADEVIIPANKTNS